MKRIILIIVHVILSIGTLSADDDPDFYYEGIGYNILSLSGGWAASFPWEPMHQSNYRKWIKIYWRRCLFHLHEFKENNYNIKYR